MKSKTTEFTASLLSITKASDGGHFHHPGLRYVRFVLCDDKPNSNKQGVEYEDFARIAESAVGSPIKMRFLGQTVGAHVASIPVGHITDVDEDQLEDGTHRLIADGVLYATDYPDEVDYLEEAFASSKAPGVSFEMKYNPMASKLIEGITWLKEVVTLAATFVRNPAYGTRTALLALASDGKVSDEDFAAGLTAIADELRPKNLNKGGNIKVEEDLKKAKEAAEAAEKLLAEATAKITVLKTANASLTTDNETLQKDLDTKEAALATVAREKLIADRTAAVAEAGVALETDEAKLAKKQEFWAKMDDESFTEYVGDLKAATKVGKPATSFASLRTASASRGYVPRVNADPDEAGDVAELRARFGSISRTRISEEE